MSDTVDTLGDALPREQARVRELITRHRDPRLSGAGTFAALMMEQALQRADRAVISGDLVEMVHSYQDLKGFTS